MSSSTSSSRRNFAELAKLLDRETLTTGLFGFLFFALVLLFVGGVRGSSSDLLASLRSIGLAGLVAVLGFLYAANKGLRPLFRTIVVAGLGFLLGGEIYFRVAVFGSDGLLRFGKYLPASVDYPLSPIPTSDRTYTGFAPNATCLLKGAVFQTNRFGFRDAERTLEKAEDSVRIVVLGASRMMGAGVAQEEVFTAVLEGILNQGDPSIRYEVINLSRGAYQTIDFLDVLETWGLRFDPDIILVRANGGRNRALRRIRTQPATTLEILEGIYHHPYSVSFFFQAVRTEFYDQVVTRARRAWRSRNRARVDLDGDAPAALVTLEEVRPEDETKYYLQEEFVRLAEGRRLFFMKTAPLRDQDLIIFIGDSHPNARAHRIYAEEIYQQLQPALVELRASNGDVAP